MKLSRCPWAENDSIMEKYHDTEWGVPLREDQKLFEFIVLDAFQAGLSWKLILHRRERFREAFANFDPKIVAQFSQKDFEKLLANQQIVRNRAKIQATIINAKKFLEIQGEFGSFANYIWSFVDNKPVINTYKNLTDFPTKNALSDRVSKDLVVRGFKFIGSTITFSFLEAAGLMNNHFLKCFRYAEVAL